jgi:heme/copper-type cytochrome/quinol oxidase subunit 1
MPRRIPDYYECYRTYNMISSLGHIITVISLIMFFLVIITMTYKINPKKN